MENKLKWITSVNGEMYNSSEYNSKEEAIANFKNEFGEEETKGYVGTISSHVASEFVCVDSIIENIRDQADCNCGEWAEDWLMSVTDEQKQDLEALITGWFDKHGLQPTFYTVEDGEEFDLKEQTK